ncbi:MAG: methyltransferase domain-containing protein, partial [Myxococcales bacterium]|nr:methyltransferase domain-containing protein [Myxococcales bacterium]
ALLAARRGARVDALDFSDEMIARLRARAAAAGVAIDATTGDGMALPYPDATFDAGFSMFGLFVFADRDRGFRELRRVLVPGGRAVVTSWPPFARSPALSTMMSAVRARLPGLQAGSADAPLGDAATFTAEMTAAGFRDVAVREVEHTRRYADADDFWSSMSRTLPPLVMLARKLGDGWPTVAAGLQADLRAALGDGPLDVPMPAWLGVGTA